MEKNKDPKELAASLAKRSVCNVQVGCVIVDPEGRAFAWGWNSAGPIGSGMCAERMALRRGNKDRLQGSTAYVWSQRGTNVLCSIPCQHCWQALVKAGIAHVVCRNLDRKWDQLELPARALTSIRKRDNVLNSKVEEPA